MSKKQSAYKVSEKEDEIDKNMSRAIGVWTLRKGIRPRDLETAMKWSYNHSWRVIKGVDKFTPSAYGQFILAYGMEAMNELFRIAGVKPAGENHGRST